MHKIGKYGDKTMDIEKIKKANTKILGKTIEYYEKIPSTHLLAKEEKKQELKNEIENRNGKIWIADTQTAGIGTKGRKWYTGIGKNIAITILVKPKCTMKDIEGITVKIAQSIQKVIGELYQIQLNIKEPNDLMYNNKKLSGILTEVNTIGEKINYILISIGMNVNEEYFDDDTKNIATSLKIELEKECSREEIIVRILENLENTVIGNIT